MNKQENSSSVTGLIVGAFIGVFVGFVGLNMIKKSQRESMLVPSLLICGIGFAVVGYFQGQKMGKDADVEKNTGISEFNYSKIQSGRSWVAVTEWTNSTGFIYKLVTGQADDKELVSILNDEVIRSYGINSGSKVNVERFHKQERILVF